MNTPTSHIESDIKAALNTVQTQRHEERQTERDRKKFTRADLEGATAIRYQHGHTKIWRPVIRVNTTTVTIQDTDRWGNPSESYVLFVHVLEIGVGETNA